jgi:diguanylate cyclase (GGDEF)-like protein
MTALGNAPSRLLMRAAEGLLIAANEESDVLAVAMDLLGEEFGYGMRYLLRYEPSRDELVMAAAAGPASDRPEVTGFRVALGVGLTGTCAATRRIVNAADVRADARYLDVVPECASEICVPVLVRDELLGVMSLQSDRTCAFSSADEELLAAFAQLLALALIHARTLRARESGIAELRALREVASVATALDPERTLQTVVDVARRVTASDSSVVYLYDAAAGELRASAVSIDTGVYPADHLTRLRGRSLRLGESVSGWVAQHRTAVKIDDLGRDPRPRPVGGAPIDAVSAIAVPLIARGRLYGVVRATKRGIASYSEDEFSLAQTIAAEAALAIAAAHAHEEVRRLAITDELTGLFNARHFRSRLDEEVRRAERYDHELALLVIDSDSLKCVNDRLGHDVGDRLLVDLAGAIRASVRSTDVAARYGGDEFVVMQPETCADAAATTGERIRQAAHGCVGELAVSVSVGVACYPTDACGPDVLFRVADQALYEAKRRGKNVVVRAGCGVASEPNGH